MPKLKFKGQVDDDEEKRGRKRRRHDKRKRDKGNITRASSSKKRYSAQIEEDIGPRKWASSDEDGESYGYDDPSTKHTKDPGPSARASKLDSDALRAEIEEEMFREKMFDALGDDERLDGLEARFNDFAHVPDRWRNAATGVSATQLYDEDEFLKLNPTMLDDEEYTEWIRLGMYRKTHAAEHAERLRRKAAEAERRAADKVRRQEIRRLERLEEEERMCKKQERRKLHMEFARTEYQARWRRLMTETADPINLRILRFSDIPWPIAAAYAEKARKGRPHPSDGSNAVLEAKEFTKEAITAFLLPPTMEDKGERKERLRESFLRFHPDKFEGRFMRRISNEDEELVREAIGQVSRTLNHLLEAIA